MGTLSELQANPDRLYPLLWLSNEGGSLEDNYKIDNVRLTMFGRVISGEEGQDDDATEIEVLSDMQLILLDFLNYFHQQHAQEYVVAKSASLEHFTERTNDRTAGYSCILELKQFYDWNKCQIPESGAGISPSVDGLTLYDFCDQSVLDRLTATQTACLEDEFGGTCAPAILTANTATFTTVASGGTLDIQVHDTADANVGTVASTSEIEIGNSSNEVNGVDIAEPTVAEGTHNQAIQNSAATPVGTAANPSVIGDSQAQVNGVNTETIAATVTHNQQIQDSAGGSVGTAANPSVITDNTINFNGADVDTVKAEESYPFLVKLDGTNSGTYNAGTNTVSVVSAVCADATTQVNAVNVGTVASGGTFDQQIHDSAGADVGTSANPSVIADATVRNNATPTWTDTVKAEDTLTLAQGKALDSDGITTLLADYIPSASGFMFTCSAGGGGSLSLGLFSDAGHTTPITRIDAGSTVYLKADATGYTPDNYLFFAYNGSKMYPIISQAGNTYTWTVGNDLQTGETSIYAQAKNVGGDQEFDLLAIEAYSYYEDLFPGAFQCCSVKLEKKLYAGAIMSIRRPSDNAVKAFYPDALERLTLTSEDGAGTSLATWIGSEDGFVYEWNDQTTNGNDWTQATLNDQPKVVSGGVLLVDTNGLAAPTFAITNGLDMPNFGGKSRVDTDSVITSTAPFILYIGASNTFSFVGVSGNTSTTTTSNFGTPIIYSDNVAVRERNRNDIYVASSGTSRLVTYEKGNTTNSDWNTSTFARYSGTNGFVGICQFNATFSGDQSATRVARATQLKANFQ